MKSTASVRFGIVFAACCALLYAVFGRFEVLVSNHNGSDESKIIASFSCFGFLLGVIIAFDPMPGERGPDRPLLRSIFGSFTGFSLGLLLQWPSEGVALSALVVSCLGYAGTYWAKYV